MRPACRNRAKCATLLQNQGSAAARAHNQPSGCLAVARDSYPSPPAACRTASAPDRANARRGRTKCPRPRRDSRANGRALPGGSGPSATQKSAMRPARRARAALAASKNRCPNGGYERRITTARRLRRAPSTRVPRRPCSPSAFPAPRAARQRDTVRQAENAPHSAR